MFRVAAGVLLALVAFGALVVSARADEADHAALQKQKDQLFQQMLANPANLDIVFAYANVSAQLGDNEAAVSALEQMLLFNPNLPRVDLELGALYFRMGSFDVARTYFDKAMASHPPPEVQKRIDQYLTLIAKQTSPSGLSGYVFFGAQYQSDANIAPGSSTIVSPIGPVLLTNQFVKESDFDIFTNGSALYTYDFGNQDHDTLEIGGQGLVNHYMKVGRLDLDFGEVTAGPRLRYPRLPVPDDILQSFTIKPYAILNEVGLGEHQYFDTYGAGFETTGIVWDDIALRAAFEFRQKTFTNQPDRPLSSGLTGNDKLVAFQAVKPITSNSTLTLEADYVDELTKLSYYANQSYAGAATYHIHYDGPSGLLGGFLGYPMETSLYVNRLYSVYFAPDPCCVVGGGFSSRDDRRWKFGIIQGVQVANNIEVIVQAERDIVSSNLPLYGYTSNSVVVGPEIKFNATPPASDSAGLSPGDASPPATAAPAAPAIAFRLEGNVGGAFSFDSAKAALTSPSLSASSTLTGSGVAGGVTLWTDGPLALWNANPIFSDLSLGLEFRHSNNSDSASVNASVPASGFFPGGSVSGTAVGNLDTESALVDVAWRQNDGTLHPYAGVGGGVSLINWSALLNAPALSGLTTSSLIAGIVSPVAAGHVFAGLDYDITPRVYLGAGADFFFTDTASKQFTHSQVQLSVDQVSLLAHAGFRF